MNVVRGILDKKTGEVIGKEEFFCDRDECNRADTTLEGLASLKPVFDKESGHGSVTAGNSSQLSDGASATLVMSRGRADALGIKPKLIFRGFGKHAGWSLEFAVINRRATQDGERPICSAYGPSATEKQVDDRSHGCGGPENSADRPGWRPAFQAYDPVQWVGRWWRHWHR